MSSSYAEVSTSGHHCNCTRHSSFSHDPFCDPILLGPSISNSSSLYPPSSSDPFPFDNPFYNPPSPHPPHPPRPQSSTSKFCPARLVVNLTRRISAGVMQLFAGKGGEKRRASGERPDMEEYGRDGTGTEDRLLDVDIDIELPECIRGPDKTELDFLRREQEVLMRNRRQRKGSRGA